MEYYQRLIVNIRRYPILYNPSHPQYKNFKEKEKVWIEIALKLREDASETKKKWNNIKDSYSKYLKRLEADSEDGRSQKNYKDWPLAEQMKPFRNFMNPDDTFDKLIDLDSEDESSDENPTALGTSSNLNATELIFLGYAKICNSLTPRLQSVTKMKIAQIILHAELENEMATMSKNNQETFDDASIEPVDIITEVKQEIDL